MRILYVSAAILPSRFANSVHVMKMCQAFALRGHEVTLVGTQGEDTSNIFEFYNVKEIFKIILSPRSRITALSRIITAIKEFNKVDVIYTRWPLSGYISGVIKQRQTIYEYHSPATTMVNKYFEKKMIRRRQGIRHVFITEALKNEYYRLYPELTTKDVLVLPDCADVSESHFNSINVDKKLTCGYIGSFQPGKGIELVIELAKELPATTFHVIGGSSDEVIKLRKSNPYSNIVWHGFLKQKEALERLANDIDIALLPNQRNVFVGKKHEVDIGRWTSPMKLFEYMAYGKSIIASRLPVLEEILHDEENALLADPDNIGQWVTAITRLQEDNLLLNQIRYQAYKDLKNKYTWLKRSELSVSNLYI